MKCLALGRSIVWKSVLKREAGGKSGNSQVYLASGPSFESHLHHICLSVYTSVFKDQPHFAP